VRRISMNSGSYYGDWVASVNRFLAGFGFLHSAHTYRGFDAYMETAYDLGMTAQNCARALAKRHEEGRIGR